LVEVENLTVVKQKEMKNIDEIYRAYVTSSLYHKHVTALYFQIGKSLKNNACK